jgi:hypothetical protein
MTKVVAHTGAAPLDRGDEDAHLNANDVEAMI